MHSGILFASNSGVLSDQDPADGKGKESGNNIIVHAVGGDTDVSVVYTVYNTYLSTFTSASTSECRHVTHFPIYSHLEVAQQPAGLHFFAVTPPKSICHHFHECAEL